MAECAFLDASDGTVFESTFAYSATQDLKSGRGAVQSSKVRAPAHLLALQVAPDMSKALLATTGPSGVSPASALLTTLSAAKSAKKGDAAEKDKKGGKKKGKGTKKSSDHVRRFPGAVFLPPLPHHVGSALESSLAQFSSAYRGTADLVAFWTYTGGLVCSTNQRTDGRPDID